VINERVKHLRKKLGLTQIEFGKKLGVTRSVIINIELNKVVPKDIFNDHICEVFNVNRKWLVNGVGEIFESGEQPNKMLNELWTLFNNLKPEYQEYILQQINQLLEIQGKEK